VKKLKLVWTNEALNRLTEIDDYISYDSIARARKFINNIIKSTTSIPQYPQKGRIVPEFNISELREIIYKNYRIVYRIKKDQIQILTIFEAHRLLRTKEIFK
jgi:toxin ParE1/3/4